MPSHVSVSLLRELVVPATLVSFVRETSTSCKGNQQLFFIQDTKQTSERAHCCLTGCCMDYQRQLPASALTLLYALVRPRISFICEFRGAFWRQKLFSWLVAINAGLQVSVEYFSSFNDLCPVTYRVLSFSQHCNKMLFPSLVLSFYYILSSFVLFCFVCSVVSW